MAYPSANPISIKTGFLSNTADGTTVPPVVVDADRLTQVLLNLFPECNRIHGKRRGVDDPNPM